MSKSLCTCHTVVYTIQWFSALSPARNLFCPCSVPRKCQNSFMNQDDVLYIRYTFCFMHFNIHVSVITFPADQCYFSWFPRWQVVIQSQDEPLSTHHHCWGEHLGWSWRKAQSFCHSEYLGHPVFWLSLEGFIMSSGTLLSVTGLWFLQHHWSQPLAVHARWLSLHWMWRVLCWPQFIPCSGQSPYRGTQCGGCCETTCATEHYVHHDLHLCMMSRLYIVSNW